MNEADKLHNAIMNMSCKLPDDMTPPFSLREDRYVKGMFAGHKQARHAAAELAAAAVADLARRVERAEAVTAAASALVATVDRYGTVQEAFDRDDAVDDAWVRLREALDAERPAGDDGEGGE